MRTPLNKKSTPTNKANLFYGKKDLAQIAQEISTITDGDAEKKAACQASIREARDAAEAAVKKKKNAKTPEEYNEACREERRQRDNEDFYRKELNELESVFTARIPDSKYYGYIESISGIVNESAEEYRKIALESMDKLLVARRKLLETINAADAAMIDLDERSQVLQSKHRKKKLVYKMDEYDENQPGKTLFLRPQYVDDMDTWTMYAKRFSDRETMENLACNNNDPKKARMLSEAWTAGKRAVSDCRGNEIPYEPIEL